MTTKNTPAKRHQRVKITGHDVNAIAKLIVRRRLTETEACLHLGINPHTWFTWKGIPANMMKNTDALARVRAAWVESRCASIEEVGDGANGTRRDWRAQSWLLERTLPERFGQQPPPPEPLKAPLNERVISVWTDLTAAMLADAQPGAVIDAEEVRQIANKPAASLPAPPPPAPPPAPRRAVLDADTPEPHWKDQPAIDL